MIDLAHNIKNMELSSSQLLPKMHENMDFDIVSEFWKYGNLEM